jgi:hypothetical protein
MRHWTVEVRQQRIDLGSGVERMRVKSSIRFEVVQDHHGRDRSLLDFGADYRKNDTEKRSRQALPKNGSLSDNLPDPRQQFLLSQHWSAGQYLLDDGRQLRIDDPIGIVGAMNLNRRIRTHSVR